MCGIFFSCSHDGCLDPDEETKIALAARGPDSFKTHHVQVRNSYGQSWYLTFASSVLSLRGNGICMQPLIDTSTGSVFCWNGEAWKLDGTQVEGNDTQEIFSFLSKVSNHATTGGKMVKPCESEILKVLTGVAGPYAFVHYDATNSRVYFGRDRLGRRSLVLNKTDAATTISSISFSKSTPDEVVTSGIHYVDLEDSTGSQRQILWQSELQQINMVSPDRRAVLPIMPSPKSVSGLIWQLSVSLQLRVLGVPTYTTTAGSSVYNPSRVAILFSGGLDCTLLARIVHDLLPVDQTVDLLNVAFENPRTVRAAQSGKQNKISPSCTSPYESCPDRITARQSFTELSQTCSTRTWRLVTINIPYSETLRHRSTVIKLMSPHNTEMDLSIALALYFASRGQGEATTSLNLTPTPYTTTARVLLSGLGADELFGGYARHAAAFSRGNWHDLNAELDLDFSRIGTRNLGRDDRVMAHWGREIRYPYLDEDFTRFALNLPAWEKVGFRSDKANPKHFEGGGERDIVTNEEELDPAKMILRLAAWRLGMKGVAAEKKRAIQFGARTAKMEGGRTKGTDLLVIE